MSRPPGPPAVHVAAERTREAERPETPPMGGLVRFDESLGEITTVTPLSRPEEMERARTPSGTSLVAAETAESPSRRRRREYRWIDRLRASDPELSPGAGSADASARAPWTEATPGSPSSSRRPAVIRVREVRRDFEYHYEYVYAEEDS